MSWPRELTPVQVLAALRAELAIRGVAITGMTLTRLGGVLILPGGFNVVCRSGWLWWRLGRLSGNGRQLHAIHPADDPVGAARRLVLLLARAAGSAGPLPATPGAT